MSSERKKGKLILEGANPMTFVENADESTESWTPEQEATASTVSKAIKDYLKAMEAFIEGKYEHLKDKIPEYMSSPGNFLIAICTDGVVIRYEKKSLEKRKWGVTVIPQRISQVVAILSQNLVHIESPEEPFPGNENFGVELKMFAHSPSQGTMRDIMAMRIWLQAKNDPPQQVESRGSKPYCLLSVRNQFDLELHGEMGSGGDENTPKQPFISRTTMSFNTGWECIEVYPGLNCDVWNSEFAPLWAERDVLGAALITQTKDSQLSNLDPRASTRRQYAALLAQFLTLLDSNPEREQFLQAFLQENPILLCPTHVRMWPKLPLGAKITDFVFRDANQEYLLVELERSTLQLFRQDGHATAELTHAQGQIVDWKRYLEDNLQTVQRELGLTGITPNPNGLLVIGRTRTLLPENRRKLQTMTNESPKLRIMTYDDVYENAKAVFENLLGPMWDTGGATQIYYPQVT
ncbi:MAG: DUF4263 domain-containing protein [Nitrosomonadales bacterium]|nr:DUF4263 domain-containing protein [Nitrosomonadales bacterium]